MKCARAGGVARQVAASCTPHRPRVEGAHRCVAYDGDAGAAGLGHSQRKCLEESEVTGVAEEQNFLGLPVAVRFFFDQQGQWRGEGGFDQGRFRYQAAPPRLEKPPALTGKIQYARAR